MKTAKIMYSQGAEEKHYTFRNQLTSKQIRQKVYSQAFFLKICFSAAKIQKKFPIIDTFGKGNDFKSGFWLQKKKYEKVAPCNFSMKMFGSFRKKMYLCTRIYPP